MRSSNRVRGEVVAEFKYGGDLQADAAEDQKIISASVHPRTRALRICAVDR